MDIQTGQTLTGEHKEQDRGQESRKRYLRGSLFPGYLDNDETSSMSVPVTDITSEPGLTERDIDRVALIGFNRER